MIDALVTGKLAAAPQRRTTKTGKPFATARLRVPTTDPAVTIFCSVAAFDAEAVAALLALGEGDAVSVAGSLKVGVWTDNNGNTRPNVDVVADRVLSVYAIRKQRAAAGGGAQHHGAAAAHGQPPSHDQWKARQIDPPAHAFAGADDIDF